jgi:hypothetical protein
LNFIRRIAWQNRAPFDAENNYRFGAKLDGLAKGALVAVSTANGHKARVVLLVEDDFIVRCGVADVKISRRNADLSEARAPR